MSVRKLISQPDGVFFITFTCTQWLPLFSLANGYDAVYKWFDHLKSQGHYIVGYVIMPNHVHAVIAFRNTGKNINGIVSNGKRFIAYELVKRLEADKQDNALNILRQNVSATENKEGKLHSVFEKSFDWKECRTTGFIEQKLNYIHNNPYKGNKLADQPENYDHSSARYYITGTHGFYKITSYMELQDVDLTAEP
jgi:REP element-mobilizing transposase RayT